MPARARRPCHAMPLVARVCNPCRSKQKNARVANPCHGRVAARMVAFSSSAVKGRSVMFLKTHIRKHEIGLLFHRGDFVRPLGPGTHYAPAWNVTRKVEVIDMLK